MTTLKYLTTFARENPIKPTRQILLASHPLFLQFYNLSIVKKSTNSYFH